jgi:superfamily II DNA or RNA helicase
VNAHYVPRDYGEAAIAAVFAEFDRSIRSTLIVHATGTGKTETYIQIAERFLRDNPDKRVLMVAHREELITQPAKRWRRNCGQWPAIEMGELRAEVAEDNELFDYAPQNKSVVIASIQTLNSGRRCPQCTAECHQCGTTGNLIIDCGCTVGCNACRGTGKRKIKCKDCEGDGWICIEADCSACFEYFQRRMQKFTPERFGLIVIDESHHIVAESYKRVVRYFRSRNPDILLLGCTATPDRADEEALGQMFESVAHEYSLPQPIIDGWLTPVEQQFVLVDGLNLANVRTTGGDLNSGDLEQEMLAEKVLHKVTTPLVEIACGLEAGTIDRLVSVNRLHELPALCTKREPTLVHAVDVAHAERMTEIINRYFPDSALCIVGTTPRTVRRDGLRRFAEGDFQFLLSCGVFLEGTDLPNVSIIGMARPTKSRALYCQMIGRGLRPLSGLIDGILTAEERVKRIVASAKPKCLVVDFVGNAGKHKLVSAADILGGEHPDALVEGIIRKAAKSGQPVDILRALAQAKAKAKKERREQARREAQERAIQQETAKQQAAARRSGIVAGASYTTQKINPFDIMDVAPKREPAWHRGRKPSEKMKEVLRKAKVPFTEETTFWEAHLLIDEVVRRRREGLCTYKMAQLLKEYGYPTEVGFSEASAIIDRLKANGWRLPDKDSSESREAVSVAS